MSFLLPPGLPRWPEFDRDDLCEHVVGDEEPPAIECMVCARWFPDGESIREIEIDSGPGKGLTETICRECYYDALRD